MGKYNKRNVGPSCSLVRKHEEIHPDFPTSETHLMLRPRSITGSMRTELGTKKTVVTKLDVPRSTWLRVSLSHLTSSGLRPSSLPFTDKCSPRTDTSVTPTRKLMSVISLPVRLSRLLGTDSSFSLEDFPTLRLLRLGLFPKLPSSIKNPSSRSLMLETLLSSPSPLHPYPIFGCLQGLGLPLSRICI